MGPDEGPAFQEPAYGQSLLQASVVGVWWLVFVVVPRWNLLKVLVRILLHPSVAVTTSNLQLPLSDTSGLMRQSLLRAVFVVVVPFRV